MNKFTYYSNSMNKNNPIKSETKQCVVQYIYILLECLENNISNNIAISRRSNFLHSTGCLSLFGSLWYAVMTFPAFRFDVVMGYAKHFFKIQSEKIQILSMFFLYSEPSHRLKYTHANNCTSLIKTWTFQNVIKYRKVQLGSYMILSHTSP